MKNLKIRNKILLPMLTLLTAVTAGNLFMLHGLDGINQQTVIIADKWMPSVESISAAAGDFIDLRVNQYADYNAAKPEDEKKYENDIQSNFKDISKDLKDYQSVMSDDKEKTLFGEINDNLQKYMTETNEIVTLNSKGEKDQAFAMLEGDSQKLYDTTLGEIDDLIKYDDNAANDEKNKAEDVFKTNQVTAISLITILFAFGLSVVFLLNKGVAYPINKITEFMKILANGDLTKNVPDRDRKDEIGVMATTIQVFKDNMVKAKELEAAEAQERAAKEVRQNKINTATEKFENSMTDIIKFVASASTELQASAQSLAASAEETSKQSTVVAAASEEASANVQTVSSASEELTASINEIAAQVTRSSQVAGKAVVDAREAGSSVSALVEAAQKIGDVTKMIAGIAEQTNLLALNATIEAARAGEAGKGFAVVAAEVKNLANESQKATEEISAKIAEVQAISRESAGAINSICGIIEEIDQISGSISAAIQEQTAATQEISRNVSEAYTGTAEVSQNIVSVREAANDTGSASTQVLSAAQELARQSDVLKREFESFIHAVETA